MFSAEDYGDYILNELDNIGKSKSCIHVIGADNASVCRRLARLMNVPFNGCRSHRLSLAAKRLFFKGDHDERPIHLVKIELSVNFFSRVVHLVISPSLCS